MKPYKINIKKTLGVKDFLLVGVMMFFGCEYEQQVYKINYHASEYYLNGKVRKLSNSSMITTEALKCQKWFYNLDSNFKITDNLISNFDLYIGESKHDNNVYLNDMLLSLDSCIETRHYKTGNVIKSCFIKKEFLEEKVFKGEIDTCLVLELKELSIGTDLMVERIFIDQSRYFIVRREFYNTRGRLQIVEGIHSIDIGFTSENM